MVVAGAKATSAQHNTNSNCMLDLSGSKQCTAYRIARTRFARFCPRQRQPLPNLLYPSERSTSCVRPVPRVRPVRFDTESVRWYARLARPPVPHGYARAVNARHHANPQTSQIDITRGVSALTSALAHGLLAYKSYRECRITTIFCVCALLLLSCCGGVRRPSVLERPSSLCNAQCDDRTIERNGPTGTHHRHVQNVYNTCKACGISIYFRSVATQMKFVSSRISH